MSNAWVAYISETGELVAFGDETNREGFAWGGPPLGFITVPRLPLGNEQWNPKTLVFEEPLAPAPPSKPLADLKDKSLWTESDIQRALQAIAQKLDLL